MASSHEITELLIDWRNGQSAALDRLMPIVYQELHRVARRRLQRETAMHSLEATELVNEVFLRLVKWQEVNWQNRAHFFALCAQLMRNILVDFARKRMADKRFDQQSRVELTDTIEIANAPRIDLIALDDALKALNSFDIQQCKIVEMRYFAGLTIEEIAEVLNISPATVKREWTMARAWLWHQLRNS